LSISNPGGGTLNWDVSDDAGWLSLDPLSGTSTGEVDDVTLSVDISGMGGGSYSATITIEAPGATNTPQTVPVSLTIAASGGGGGGGGGGGKTTPPQTEPTTPPEQPEEPVEPTVPTPEPTTPPAQQPSDEGPAGGGSSGLTPGAWVGIGIGLALLLAVVVWLILRRWVWAAHGEES